MAKKPYKKPQITREELEAALLEANDALWRANRKLEAEEKARMELLSNLSHDLRSPVAALTGSVELLKSGCTGKEQREILEVMERRLKTMQSMINDLFLLATVESPTSELHVETMEAGAFLEEFFYSCEADPKYDRRKLVLQVPDTFPYLIAVDAEKMARVLDNLFTNALRYSEDGDEIRLGAIYLDGSAFPDGISGMHTRSARTDQGRKNADVGSSETGSAGAWREVADAATYVEIWVEDTGKGISGEDLPHIFERSYRVSRSRTPGDGGSGLGLAIAKGIVEKHDGSIRCESVPGVGSRFTVRLPLA